MRNLFIFVLVITNLLISTASSQPRIYIKTMDNIVNATSSDQEVSKTVTVENKGKSLLSLEVKETSCGCTGATLSAESLAPGQTAILTIKMQVSGWGIKTETVTLSTNDPKQPHAVITLQAKMPATVVPNPARLTMQTHEGETR